MRLINVQWNIGFSPTQVKFTFMVYVGFMVSDRIREYVLVGVYSAKYISLWSPLQKLWLRVINFCLPLQVFLNILLPFAVNKLKAMCSLGAT